MNKRPFYKMKRFLIPLVLLLLAGGCGAAIKGLKAKAEAKRVAGLQPAKPVRGTLVTKTQAAGSVEPENRVLVTPSVSGRAEEVLFTEGMKVEKGTMLAWISSSERTALLDSLKTSETTPAEKKLVEEAYNLTPVVAPIRGMVVKRAVEPGQSVSQAREIAVISDRLIIKTFVDETDIGSVKEGQAAEYFLDAFPKEKRRGRVLAIAHESTQKEGVTVYEVKILPSDGEAKLRSGMTADVLVVTGSKKNALTIPKKAARYRDGDVLVQVRKDPKAKLTEKKITVGAANETSLEVLSGLDETDTVYYSTGIAKEKTSITIGAD